MGRIAVVLSADELAFLRKKVSSGVSSARETAHARALLGSHGGLTRDRVAREAGVSQATLDRIRARFAQGGMEAALSRRTQPPRPEKRKLTDETEARLIALACSEAPEGRARWTLRLLADRAVELGVVETGLSHESVRRALKNELRPHRIARWVIPPKESAAFVACMEDVLGLYARPHDPEFPVVCLDEMPVQLLSHTREPLPMRPGDDRKEDHEYAREGTASVFAALDLKGGRRLIEAAERRAKADFARFVRRVVDELCAGCKGVRLVLDNLSTHSKAALYEAFEPEEAYRLAQKVELHFTPRHGSWLNAVELEFSAARGQCLDRRVASLEELRKELAAWQDERNAKRNRVRWTFDVPAARAKLKRIYPANEP